MRSGLTAVAPACRRCVRADIIDGFEVARTLRSNGALPRTRLIPLSGYAQAEDRLRARDAWFDAHLPKPPSLSELNDLLAEGG